jgi:hypothetical protein
VAFTLQGQADARVEQLPLREREASFTFAVDAPVLRVDLDPSFDVMRRLDRTETPPSLGEIFGAEAVTIVVPAPGADPLAAGWRELASGWQRGEQVQVVSAEDLQALPADRAVWVLGTHNRWRDAVAPFLDERRAGPQDGALQVGAARYPLAGHSFAFAARHPANPDLAVGWIGGDVAAALPGLARKLPHYGKYSYLTFTGEAPDNVAKGLWEATGSPLIAWTTAERVPRGRLPARAPLARLAPVFDQARLLEHVRLLASDELQGRGLGTPGLDRATAYVVEAFRTAGLQPGGDDGTYLQRWEEAGPPAHGCANVIGVLPGTREDWVGQSVVVGAHLDHLGLGWPDVRAGNQGQIHNGADDNASGVAVLLELAALLGAQPQPRTIVFVAFTAEEWGRRGSRHFVHASTDFPPAQCMGMLNLDTVGRLGQQKLTLLGAGTAREWRHIAMGVGYTTGVEAVCVPQDPGGSDQVSFHEVQVPALQLFTGPHADYHRPSDDVERIDAPGLVKVATFAREVLIYLAGREEPLHASFGAAPATGGPTGERRASLGTMPDFTFPGPGVKVAQVLEGSPAAAAGLRAGDVLVALAGTAIEDLRGFSTALEQHRPGDRVTVTIQRDGQELKLEATLAER